MKSKLKINKKIKKMEKTKVILVGESRVEKTSVINQYVENSFSDEYIITISVETIKRSRNKQQQN